MRRLWMIGLLFTVLILASGCNTDVKNIEHLNYVTAIGVDYKDGKIYCYIQFIDMHSEAKTSEGKREAAKIWIGEGVGRNFEEAVFQMYQSAQERVYWGHTTALIFSESLLKHGVEAVYDSITRYSEFRYTPWVYSTRGSVKAILQTKGFYDQSPLNTILHVPEGIYAQTSTIESIKLHRFVREIREPGYTACIPTLTLDNRHWSQSGKKKNMLTIDGAVFYKDGQLKGYVPIQELMGLRWFQRETIRAGVSVPSPEKPSVQVIVNDPKSKLTRVHDGAYPKFNIRIRAKGYVVNRVDNTLSDDSELTQATENAIRAEIEQLYDVSVKRKLDIMNMEYRLFRHHHSEWAAVDNWESRLLNGEAIGGIAVDISIKHASAVKNRRKE
ncbi:Ger(x)C family spore germination protein [Paenibacillus paeoniae]|uniref:Ger(X)C family spore germination protein n=1 Tax=Paenibacillus paeoniae TaxID=2292705 RepID=A0A371PN52_9BACL|nr:Ger(x)C family spore germination protein [Paenibacillus paeoniae]REK77563.1 Ger(x)C family spore germination protein [Paenibacillus paeoniae]